MTLDDTSLSLFIYMFSTEREISYRQRLVGDVVWRLPVLIYAPDQV